MSRLFERTDAAQLERVCQVVEREVAALAVARVNADRKARRRAQRRLPVRVVDRAWYDSGSEVDG